MGFWIASADSATGNRVVGSEELLSPGPGDLRWPDGQAGVLLDTPNGNLIRQQPTRDSRTRAWIWMNVPRYKPSLMRLIGRLEALVSAQRRALGLSPWVYLRDTETHKLRRQLTATGTVTSATSTTLADTSQLWTVNDIANGYGVVEIIQGSGRGDRRTVTANTINQLTVQTPFSVVPTGASYALTYNSDVWVRVRVLDVVKQVRAKSGLIYDSVAMTWVLDDPVWKTQDF